MANLFIVRTPMQIVSALEAMDYFQTSDNILVIIHNRKKNNLQQIQRVMELFDLHHLFDEIMEVHHHRQSKFFLLLNLIQTLKRRTYETLFLGLYDSMGRLFLSNLIYRNAYLIDDGTATIIAHHRIVNSMKTHTVGLKALRARLFGLRLHHHNAPLGFFTLFQLPQYAQEPIITHRFAYLKRYFSQPDEYSNIIYLLGQNITDVPIVSKEKYLCYIQQILEKYPDHDIVYIPHRAETLHQELQTLPNRRFTIQKTTLPIELYFLMHRIYPTHVISFFTSALYTLNILFENSTIESFNIALEDIESHHNSVMQCQEFLKTTSVIHSPLQRYNDCKML